MHQVIPIVVTLVVVACGADPTPSVASETQPAPIASQAPDEVTFLEAWQARLPGLMTTASAFERGLIADGVVTEAEHELAINNYLKCIQRAGLQVTGFERGPSGMIILLGVDGPQRATEQDPVLRCQSQFYTYAREGFHATTVDPNGSEQAVLRAIAACLRERGIHEVPEEPESFVQISRIISTITFNDHANLRRAGEADHACQTEVMG
jgi:hypothetical protein